jgi:hypothetical protein
MKNARTLKVHLKPDWSRTWNCSNCLWTTQPGANLITARYEFAVHICTATALAPLLEIAASSKPPLRIEVEGPKPRSVTSGPADSQNEFGNLVSS